MHDDRIALYERSGNSARLVVLDPDSGALTSLLSDGHYNANPSWSPDGQWLSFVRMQDGNSDVYIVRADGTDERRITDTQEREFHPKWSADGKHVYFDGGPSDLHSICRVDINTLARQCFPTPEGWLVSTPAESHDGKAIAFACRDGQGGNICIMNSDGTGARLLIDVEPGLNAGAPYFSPDNSKIVYHQGGDGVYEIVIRAVK